MFEETLGYKEYTPKNIGAYNSHQYRSYSELFLRRTFYINFIDPLPFILYITFNTMDFTISIEKK